MNLHQSRLTLKSGATTTLVLQPVLWKLHHDPGYWTPEFEYEFKILENEVDESTGTLCRRGADAISWDQYSGPLKILPLETIEFGEHALAIRGRLVNKKAEPVGDEILAIINASDFERWKSDLEEKGRFKAGDIQFFFRDEDNPALWSTRYSPIGYTKKKKGEFSVAGPHAKTESGGRFRILLGSTWVEKDSRVVLVRDTTAYAMRYSTGQRFSYRTARSLYRGEDIVVVSIQAQEGSSDIDIGDVSLEPSRGD